MCLCLCKSWLLVIFNVSGYLEPNLAVTGDIKGYIFDTFNLCNTCTMLPCNAFSDVIDYHFYKHIINLPKNCNYKKL